MWRIIFYGFIIFILSKFRTKLLAANHLIIKEKTTFNTEKKSSKFLLQIMTLVLSANNTGSATEFILKGRSFIYIMNNRGPRLANKVSWFIPSKAFAISQKMAPTCIFWLTDLPPWRDIWYPLCRRLSGPHGQSGWVQKISPPPGFKHQTVQFQRCIVLPYSRLTRPWSWRH